MPTTPTICWRLSRNGAAISDEPDSENSLFSEPMKMRTPSALSARDKSSITSFWVSRSANSSLIRSRSSWALRSSSRLAWPRTINWRAPSLPTLTARPASTSRAVSSSSWPAICERCASRSERSSPMVRPLSRALRKFVASVSADAGNPGGRARMRFSTCPSSPTSTTRARVGSSITNSTCLSRVLVLLASTTPAPRDRPDSRLDASASTPSRERPAAALTWASMAARSSPVGSPTSIMASTKKRRPFSVGMRPAEVCGAKIRPASSRSDMTLRTEAGESVIGMMREMLREPSGSP